MNQNQAKIEYLKQRINSVQEQVMIRDTSCLLLTLWEKVCGPDDVPTYFDSKEEYELAKAAVSKWPTARKGYLLTLGVLQDQLRIAETQERYDAAKEGRIGDAGQR